MSITRTLLLGTALAAAGASVACARTPTPAPERATATVRPAPAQTPAATARPRAGTPQAALPPVVVHKSPTCGCCTLWVEHMRAAEFAVEVRETDALEPVKQKLGVPYGKGSCHTAEIAGYFVEGHVPADDIKRFLRAKPKAKGLVLPGMPLGSPGMETPDGRVQPYTVEQVQADGSTVPFARHGQED